MLKYYCSYRQWNLMDQEWILREVLEKAGYVSLRFREEIKLARTLPPGRRPFDREFLLPDYQSSFRGEIQLPPALLQREAEQEDEDTEEESEDDTDDEDIREEDMTEQDVELDLNEVAEDSRMTKAMEKETAEQSKKSGDVGDPEDEDDQEDDQDKSDADDDMEEDIEESRQRLLMQREEEDRRKRAIEAERQALRLTLERFAVPEVLFHPSDGGLPRDWAGLAVAVVQAIENSPEYLRAALYQSIRLVGGLSQLPNLKHRLEQELRSLVSCDYDLSVFLSEMPGDEAWNGTKALALSRPYVEWGDQS